MSSCSFLFLSRQTLNVYNINKVFLSFCIFCRAHSWPSSLTANGCLYPVCLQWQFLWQWNMELQRHRPRAEAPLQLLRHAAYSAHLRHRLRQRAGVYGCVQGKGSADHHKLPDRQPGCRWPSGGHTCYALGCLLRGRIVEIHAHTLCPYSKRHIAWHDLCSRHALLFLFLKPFFLLCVSGFQKAENCHLKKQYLVFFLNHSFLERG